MRNEKQFVGWDFSIYLVIGNTDEWIKLAREMVDKDDRLNTKHGKCGFCCHRWYNVLPKCSYLRLPEHVNISEMPEGIKVINGIKVAYQLILTQEDYFDPGFPRRAQSNCMSSYKWKRENKS